MIIAEEGALDKAWSGSFKMLKKKKEFVFRQPLRNKDKKDLKFYIIPIIHLLLNFSYSPMFFYFKQILGSAILTLFVLFFAILTMIQFGITNKNLIPVYLFIPYILWLIFANYLSWSIYKLNK